MSIEFFNDEGALVCTAPSDSNPLTNTARMAAMKATRPRVFRARCDGEWFEFIGDEPVPLDKELDDLAWSQELPIEPVLIRLGKRQAD